ncbi:hypothetical protein CBR_g47086 [Chara braunii]|uniref:3'-5' exonuclease domain-containing protein n=1 Tax=Chara braunii TaxID=69332 RepID=A0A388M1C9_CHABU|nr:hypothetical protein CBR_g47086 [Chara braunii]|eukprot:GBG88387.1 hypothetical protein CBR_g47086 [Chara braunii]
MTVGGDPSEPRKLVIVIFPDGLSEVSPAMAVLALKKWYREDTSKAAVKFAGLRRGLQVSLATAPPPGPFTYTYYCLRALEDMEPLYSVGFAHMLLMALPAVPREYRTDADVACSRKLAAKMLVDGLQGKFSWDDKRLLFRIVVAFNLRLEDLDDAAVVGGGFGGKEEPIASGGNEPDSGGSGKEAAGNGGGGGKDAAGNGGSDAAGDGGGKEDGSEGGGKEDGSEGGKGVGVNGGKEGGGREVVMRFVHEQLEARARKTALEFLDLFDLRLDPEEEKNFIEKMVVERKLDIAIEWAGRLGKDTCAFLIEKLRENQQWKLAHVYVEKLDLKDRFPDSFQLYREGTVRSLVAHGRLDIAASMTLGHEALGKYLISYLVTEGCTKKAAELCARLDLPIDFDVNELEEEEDSSSSPGSFLTVSSLIPPENVRWIATMEGLQEAREILNHLLMESTTSSSSSFYYPPAIGMDCEWRASHIKGEPQRKTSVLQLATLEHVFLIDLIDLSAAAEGTEALQQFVSWIFQAPHVLKLGYGMRSDLTRLAQSYPEIPGFRRCERVLDLYDFAGLHVRGGLSALSEVCLGLPLDKRWQMSDWEKRPLSQNQLEYAALDALSVTHIFKALLTKGLRRPSRAPGCDATARSRKSPVLLPKPAPQTGVQQTGVPQTGVPLTGAETVAEKGCAAEKIGAAEKTGAAVPQTGVPQTGVPQTGVPQTGEQQTGVPQTGVPKTGVETVAEKGWAAEETGAEAEAEAEPGIEPATLAEEETEVVEWESHVYVFDYNTVSEGKRRSSSPDDSEDDDLVSS